jgi:hypothetical protein
MDAVALLPVQGVAGRDAASPACGVSFRPRPTSIRTLRKDSKVAGIPVSSPPSPFQKRWADRGVEMGWWPQPFREAKLTCERSVKA